MGSLRYDVEPGGTARVNTKGGEQGVVKQTTGQVKTEQRTTKKHTQNQHSEKEVRRGVTEKMMKRTALKEDSTHEYRKGWIGVGW